MTQAVLREDITPSEAVARKILRDDETRFVSSVTKVGAGGFGSVYKISLKRSFSEQDTTPWMTSALGRDVYPHFWIRADKLQALARKIIEISRTDDEVDYQREVETMKALCNSSQNNIVQFLGDGVIVPGTYYFIDMELCDINLRQYMNGEVNVTGIYGLPSWNKEEPDMFMIAAIMQQLLSGLAFVHSEKKVHRDIDPTNVLYSATDGWWKLADLGLTSDGTSGGKVTQLGRGKPGYRAPELVRTDQPGSFSKETDTWSLGCVFYELCIGAPRFISDVYVHEYAKSDERLDIEFPLSFRRSVAQIVFESMIREMLDRQPERRPTAKELGNDFWRVMSLLTTSSMSSAMEHGWQNIDFLSPENLLSTDMPSINQLTMKEIPPRWEHVLFQGASHSHNIKTLARSKQVLAARELLLGASHALTIHSRVRLAWTSFYMNAIDVANPSDQFKKLLELTPAHEHIDRETVSYLAGLGWSERIAGNWDEAFENFKKAIDIQHHLGRSTDADTLAYMVALEEMSFAQAIGNIGKPGRKRKRSGVDDSAAARLSAERALWQMNLIFNCQCLKLGRGHPDTVETMKFLGKGYQVLASIRPTEQSIAKISRHYYAASAEFLFTEALELGREHLGIDHPYTLYTLTEVGHLELEKGMTAEAIVHLEEAFAKQKYVLGIDDFDTKATITNLQGAYKISKETKKYKSLMMEVGNKSPNNSRQSLKMCNLDNRADDEGDISDEDRPLGSQSP